MSNKKVRSFNKVYIRKIERNKIKKIFKTNKIADIWHELRKKTIKKGE